MTPRRLMALLVFAGRRQRADDARRFGLIRAAMHADKAQAQRLLDELLAED